MKKQEPKLFKPSLDDQRRVAEMLSKNFPKSKGIGLSNGEVVKGTREQESLNDQFNEHTNSADCFGNDCMVCDDYSKQINAFREDIK